MSNPSPKRSETEAPADSLEAPLRAAGLTGRLGFHIRMAQVAMHRDFLAALKPLDLSQKSCAVLTLLRENPGIRQIDLANALVTDRATMMAIVDRLQDRGLLYRERSKIDRRRQDLFLTEAGAEILSRADALIEAHEARFTGQFSKAELGLLTELLMRVYGT